MVVSLASTGGNARVFIVNGGGLTSKNAAAWLEEKVAAKRKKPKGGQGGTGGEGEIRLIQDFDFPEASNKVKTTPDGKFLIATGTYKPKMKVFELDDLAMKTERVTDSENIDFTVLSSDWTKTLHLQSDRSLDLHTQSSSHYRVRMPRHGRCVGYHFPSCDALVGGQGSEVWRVNLELGRFMKPFCLEGSTEFDGGENGEGIAGGQETVTGVNVLDVNPVHQLLSFGTETAQGRGTVEMWDPRSRSRVGILRLPYSSLLSAGGSAASLASRRLPGVDDESSVAGIAVSALASRRDGLNLAVGTSTGHVLLYDLRTNRPYTTKDQGFGLPIKKVEWYEAGAGASEGDAEGGWVASADEKVVKIWGKDTGKNLISINPPMPINDMHIYPSSGLVFLANEATSMSGYYVPQLGPAPKWCRFLDNMTDEMAEDKEQTLYDDYKFVDRNELEKLNLTNLLGTPMLKPYMHGYFVDLRLYTKARAIANPFEYTEYRERLAREKLEKEQESRIRGSKTPGAAGETLKVKVNKALAKKLQEVAPEEEGGKRKKKKAAEEPADKAALLTDERFSKLFADSDFQIDERSREFEIMNPSGSRAPRQAEENDDDDEDEDEGIQDDGSEDEQISEEEDSSDEERVASTFRQRAAPAPAASKPRQVTMQVDDQSDSDDSEADQPPKKRKADVAALSFAQRAKQAGRKSVVDDSVEFQGLGSTDIIRGTAGGNMEMSFIPSEATTNANNDARKEKLKAKKAKEQSEKGKFGAGLEKRRGAKNEPQLEGEEASGRQRRRKPERSASKNVMRKLKPGY